MTIETKHGVRVLPQVLSVGGKMVFIFHGQQESLNSSQACEGISFLK